MPAFARPRQRWMGKVPEFSHLHKFRIAGRTDILRYKQKCRKHQHAPRSPSLTPTPRLPHSLERGLSWRNGRKESPHHMKPWFFKSQQPSGKIWIDIASLIWAPKNSILRFFQRQETQRKAKKKTCLFRVKTRKLDIPKIVVQGRA